MKAAIDDNLCAGCGTCAEVCPAVFELRGDLAVNILGEDEVIPAEYEESCRQAADACPVAAIIIEE